MMAICFNITKEISMLLRMEKFVCAMQKFSFLPCPSENLSIKIVFIIFITSILIQKNLNSLFYTY